MSHFDRVVNQITDLADTLPAYDLNRLLSYLAAHYLGDKTQVCSWCLRSYLTTEQAAQCAKTCSMKAAAAEAALTQESTR